MELKNKLQESLMKALILTVLTLVSFNALAVQDIIQSGNGVQATAPEGYEAVFIPKGTKGVLITQKRVPVIRPRSKPSAPVECTPKGGLVLGAGTVFCSEWADNVWHSAHEEDLDYARSGA